MNTDTQKTLLTASAGLGCLSIVMFVVGGVLIIAGLLMFVIFAGVLL